MHSPYSSHPNEDLEYRLTYGRSKGPWFDWKLVCEISIYRYRWLDAGNLEMEFDIRTEFRWQRVWGGVSATRLPSLHNNLNCQQISPPLLLRGFYLYDYVDHAAAAPPPFAGESPPPARILRLPSPAATSVENRRPRGELIKTSHNSQTKVTGFSARTHL